MGATPPGMAVPPMGFPMQPSMVVTPNGPPSFPHGHNPMQFWMEDQMRTQVQLQQEVMVLAQNMKSLQDENLRLKVQLVEERETKYSTPPGERTIEKSLRSTGKTEEKRKKSLRSKEDGSRDRQALLEEDGSADRQALPEEDGSRTDKHFLRRTGPGTDKNFQRRTGQVTDKRLSRRMGPGARKKKVRMGQKTGKIQRRMEIRRRSRISPESHRLRLIMKKVSKEKIRKRGKRIRCQKMRLTLC